MRQLMLGNKALARGLHEGGCSIVSSYPGTPSTEVTEEAVKFEEIYCEWAPNEKGCARDSVRRIASRKKKLLWYETCRFKCCSRSAFYLLLY